MQRRRYGIIGFGAFAERAIMPAIRASENSELVAIQKRSLDVAKWKAQEHNIPLFFDSPEELVASPEVDAVFIVSANSQHCHETLIAAEAGKHVLVEKPMAMSYAQAVKMVDVCTIANVRLMVGHMLRFSPLIHRMKEILASGMLGEISYARAEFIYDARNTLRNWLWDKNIAGGGPLYDIGVHCLDSMRCILNDEVTTVRSMMRTSSDDCVETTNLLSLRFAQGTLATIYSSFETAHRHTFIEFFGSEGSLSAFNFTPSNTHAAIEIKMGKDGNIDSVNREEIVVPDLYRLEVNHFSDCILNNKEPLVSNESSLHNQYVLELALHGNP